MKNATRKFDYVLSNPPYQDTGNSAIFHVFQEYADSITQHVSMIYPADKWMLKSGKGEGLDAFAAIQLNSPYITSITVYEDAQSVFGGIELHGGISIVAKDFSFHNDGCIAITTIDFDSNVDCRTLNAPGDRTLSTSNAINGIVEKVLTVSGDAQFLHDIALQTSLYGIGSNFIENNRSVAIPDGEYQHGEYHHEQNYVRVLANNTTGTQGRVQWFWVPENSVPKMSECSSKYVVAISTRHASGYGGRSQQARIFHPNEYFGDSRYAVAAFDTREEAQNFFTWMSSNVIRLLILSSSRRIKNFGTNVPLLTTYTSKNTAINFSQNIDKQLYHCYDFTSDEILFIEKTIATLGSFAMEENTA